MIMPGLVLTPGSGNEGIPRAIWLDKIKKSCLEQVKLPDRVMDGIPPTLVLSIFVFIIHGSMQKAHQISF